MNVGAGAIPSDNLPLRIANRKCSRSKPAIGSIPAPYPVLRLIRDARLDASCPMSLDSLQICGIDVVEPPKPVRRLRAGSGIFEKAFTDVVTRAVASTAEDDVRRGLQNGIQLFVLHGELNVEQFERFRLLLQL